MGAQARGISCGGRRLSVLPVVALALAIASALTACTDGASTSSADPSTTGPSTTSEPGRDGTAMSMSATTFELDDVETPGSDPVARAPEDDLIDSEQLARLVAFIEAYLDRTFDAVPDVTVVEAEDMQANVPEGTFVGPELWDTLVALELVAGGDDRLAADAARREQIRGVCCPVFVVDSGDPFFNEVVLVHELTHGLDFQLDIGPSAAREPVDPVLALIEGNAHRVAFAYAEELGRRGTSIDDPPNVFADPEDGRLPAVVRRILEFPYDEGLRFSAALAAAGGEQAVADAFAEPPTSSEQIVNPVAYLTGDEPVDVPSPTMRPESRFRHRGSLGAFLLSLLMEPQLGRDDAIELALTWAGDAYVLYEHNADLCISATVELDTSLDARALLDAIDLDGAETSLDGNQAMILNCVASTP